MVRIRDMGESSSYPVVGGSIPSAYSLPAFGTWPTGSWKRVLLRKLEVGAPHVSVRAHECETLALPGEPVLVTKYMELW